MNTTTDLQTKNTVNNLSFENVFYPMKRKYSGCEQIHLVYEGQIMKDDKSFAESKFAKHENLIGNYYGVPVYKDALWIESKKDGDKTIKRIVTGEEMSNICAEQLWTKNYSYFELYKGENMPEIKWDDITSDSFISSTTTTNADKSFWYTTGGISSNKYRVETVRYKEFHTAKLIKTIGKKTFVYWDDDTFTKVTCEKDQKPDPFAAFCIAFTKKMFGSTTKVMEAIEEADEKEKRKREKEANRKAHEENRKKEREAFDKEVEAKRHELAVLRAAEKKLKG